MKFTYKIKKLCIIALSLLLMVTGLMFAISMNFFAVHADCIIEGASIRYITENNEGNLRFDLKISKTVLEGYLNDNKTELKGGVELGVVVCPSDLLPTNFNSNTALDYVSESGPVIKRVLPFHCWKEEDDSFKSSVYFLNMPEQSFNRNIMCICWIDDNGSITYSSPIERSIAYVAKAAMPKATEYQAYILDKYLLNYAAEFEVDGVITKSVNVKYGEMINESDIPADPIKDGDTFCGWYVDNHFADVSSYVMTKRTRFVARYESSDSVYELAYSLNDINKGIWYGTSVMHLNYGTGYANQIVAVKVKINGTVSSTYSNKVGLVFYNSKVINVDSEGVYYSDIQEVATSKITTTDTWEDETLYVLLNSNGEAWIGVWNWVTPNESAIPFTINIKNPQLLGLVSKTKASGSDTAGTKIVLDAGMPNTMVTYRAEIAGTHDPSVSINRGIASYFTDNANDTINECETVYVLDSSYLCSYDFKEAYITGKTNANGQLIVSWVAWGAVSGDMYLKNIQLMNALTGTHRLFTSDGWDTPAGYRYEASFGADNANKTVNIEMKVCGAITSSGKIGFMTFASQYDAVNKYQQAELIGSVDVVSNIDKISSVIIPDVPLNSEGKTFIGIHCWEAGNAFEPIFIKAVSMSDVKKMSFVSDGVVAGRYSYVEALPTNIDAGEMVEVSFDFYGSIANRDYPDISCVEGIDPETNEYVFPQVYVVKDISAYDGTWQRITFTATVLDNTAFKLGSITHDFSGHYVLIYGVGFVSSDTVMYKNLSISRVKSVELQKRGDGYKTTINDKQYDSYCGMFDLPTDIAAGTPVCVEMDVCVNTKSLELDIRTDYILGSDMNYQPWLVGNYSKKILTTYSSDIANGVQSVTGEWQHIIFYAVVSNEPYVGLAYGKTQIAKIGNYVPLYVDFALHTAGVVAGYDKISYKNVTISKGLETEQNITETSDYVGIVDIDASAFNVGATIKVEFDAYVISSSSSIGFYSATELNLNGVQTDSLRVDGIGENPRIESRKLQHFVFETKVLASGTVELLSGNTKEINHNFALLYIDGLVKNGNAELDYVDVKNMNLTLVYDSTLNSLENYKIVIPEKTFPTSTNSADYSPTYYAATILQAYIYRGTGLFLDICTDESPATGMELIVGNANRTICRDYDFDSLGEEKYIVKNYCNDLVVIANNSRGVIYGVYAFLESLGYNFYTDSDYDIPDASNFFISNNLDIEWNPSFNLRELVFGSEFYKSDLAVSLGLNGQMMRNLDKDKFGGTYDYAGGSSKITHTITWFLPDTLFTGDSNYNIPSYKEWFALQSDGTYSKDFPCLSNTDQQRWIKAQMLKYIRNHYEKNGQLPKSINFSLKDGIKNENCCHCAECTAKVNAYGAGGAWLIYLNEFAKTIKESYSTVKLESLAYGWTYTAPTALPTDFDLSDNLVIKVCTASVCVLHDDCTDSLYEFSNLKKWIDTGVAVYVYYYSVDILNYMEIWPSFDGFYKHIKKFHSMGVKGVFIEGFSNQDGEFGALRSFLYSKLLQHPEMSYDNYRALMRLFINNYYGGENVGEKIYSYIVKTESALSMSDKHLLIDASAKDNGISFTSAFVDEIDSIWSAAEQIVSAHPTYLKRVQTSKIHWTYSKLSNMNGSGNQNAALFNDMVRLGAVYINGGTAIRGGNSSSKPIDWNKQG
ncbi:MAG: DUF4838 domain-containing protein, partial [Candidatus Borkfalkiaceae bacterium]|nr:DUF4838 domain-containing protein [Christensenellaceae bacterium]